MRRFDLTGRTLAGLLALGLILGSTPGRPGGRRTAHRGPLLNLARPEEAPAFSSSFHWSPLCRSHPLRRRRTSHLAALDRLLALGLSQEEADSLWLRQGAAGIETCPPRGGGGGAALPAPAELCPPERLDRYQAELARSPETSPEEAVVRVNIGLDAPPYGVGEPVDEPPPSPLW